MFLVRLSLCVCAVRGGDEKEPFSAGVTLVRKAAAQEEGDKDDKKGGKKLFVQFLSAFFYLQTNHGCRFVQSGGRVKV